MVRLAFFSIASAILLAGCASAPSEQRVVERVTISDIEAPNARNVALAFQCSGPAEQCECVNRRVLLAAQQPSYGDMLQGVIDDYYSTIAQLEADGSTSAKFQLEAYSILNPRITIFQKVILSLAQRETKFCTGKGEAN